MPHAHGIVTLKEYNSHAIPLASRHFETKGQNPVMYIFNTHTHTLIYIQRHKYIYSFQGCFGDDIQFAPSFQVLLLTLHFTDHCYWKTSIRHPANDRLPWRNPHGLDTKITSWGSHGALVHRSRWLPSRGGCKHQVISAACQVSSTWWRSHLGDWLLLWSMYRHPVAARGGGVGLGYLEGMCRSDHGTFEGSRRDDDRKEFALQYAGASRTFEDFGQLHATFQGDLFDCELWHTVISGNFV